MQQFPAPAKPANFDTVVEKHRRAVEKLFNAGKLAAKGDAKRTARTSASRGRRTVQPARGPKSKKVDPFPPQWSAFKDVLSQTQYRKCAFCEGYAIGQGFGDVEHFAPKAEVQALRDDEATWGVERDFLANVTGRITDSVSATGYWWLAYEWDNYILACTICNQQWKRAIFPIKEQRAAAPKQGDAETGYLLHPFRGEAPKDHLEFGSLGEITPRTVGDAASLHGRETIRTLGLDRPSLREQRRPIASKVHKKIDGLADATVARRLELLGDIRDEGRLNQPFCGVVRAIFEQRTGMTWAQLEAQLGP